MLRSLVAFPNERTPRSTILSPQVGSSLNKSSMSSSTRLLRMNQHAPPPNRCLETFRSLASL